MIDSRSGRGTGRGSSGTRRRQTSVRRTGPNGQGVAVLGNTGRVDEGESDRGTGRDVDVPSDGAVLLRGRGEMARRSVYMVSFKGA